MSGKHKVYGVSMRKLGKRVRRPFSPSHLIGISYPKESHLRVVGQDSEQNHFRDMFHRIPPL